MPTLTPAPSQPAPSAPVARPERPRAAPRAAMAVAAFLAVGLCIHLVLSLAYERTVEARTVDGIQKAYFEAFDEPIQVLVVGASHSRGGFDTRLTDDALTYAFPAEGYPMVYYRLLHALEEHPEVEHVIGPIGPYYFSDRGEPYPEDWIGFDEAFRYGEAGGDTWGYLKDAFRRHVFPYAGKSQTTFEFTRNVEEEGKTDRNEIVRGYQPNYTNMGPERMQESAQSIADTHYPGGVDPTHANYLERIAALCAERGIALTLVNWPVTERYARLADGRYDPAVMPAALARARTHLPITVVDLYDVFQDREYLFGNADHVNAAGSYLATRMILEQAGLPVREEITGPLPAPPHLRRHWDRIMERASADVAGALPADTVRALGGAAQ